MLRRVIVVVSVIVAIWGLCCSGYAADIDKDISFYLTFDNTLDARVPTGTEAPQGRPGVKYEKGVKGEALIVNGMDRLWYKAKEGYFSFEEGTISLWIKPNYDDDSFREKVDKDRKVKGWYFSQNFISISNYDKVKLCLGLSHSHRRRIAANLYTYPLVQHYKSGKIPFEKDKWINFLYTWNALDENIEFYINGKRVETKISERGYSWDMPEKIDYSLCRIMICGANIHGKKVSAGSKKDISEILGDLLPADFTYAIDEVRIYSRELTEEEIEELSSFEQF